MGALGWVARLVLLGCWCWAGVWARGPEELESNAAVQRFREYLRIPTVQPEPDFAPAIEFLQRQAREIGLPCVRLEFVEKNPILVMTWKGSGSEEEGLKSVILNSHMDVVPVERANWKHDPFGAEMDEDGNIFARGSQDMKVVGIQYLEAIRILTAKGYVPLRDVHVVWVPDEEKGGGSGWGKFVESKEFEALNVGVVLDEGRVSSTDSYVVTHGEKAPWWLVIRAVGNPGHGSIIVENSAADNLFKSLASITSYRDSQLDLVKAGLATIEEIVTINSVFLKSGAPTPDGFTMNVQPSVAEAGFDIRLPPIATLSGEIDKRIAEEWAPKSRNMTSEFKLKTVTMDGNVPITAVDDSNPWWTLLLKAVGKFNSTAVPVIATGATDSRFARLKGIPALGFTPVLNTPFLLHSDDEFVNGWEFLKGIPVLEEVISLYGSFSETFEERIFVMENVG